QASPLRFWGGRSLMPVQTVWTCDGDHKHLTSHRFLLHPVFAWLGLRPVLGQHTTAEETTLKKWAAGRLSLVEIGVAEGASAMALREVMSPEGTLYLIDPFHLSRHPRLNATRRAAHRAVASCHNGQVVWKEAFSSEAVRGWEHPIGFLFLD